MGNGIGEAAGRTPSNNRATWRCFVAMIVGVLVWSGLAWGQSFDVRRPRVMITVFDEAGVEHSVVERAEARVERELQASGIGVWWQNPGWDGNAPVAGGKDSTGETLLLHIHILPRARNAAGEVFGMAFLGKDGRGQQADLFYDRIEKLGSHQAQDRAALLGAVMAHELGHLLLGTHAHTTSGIMQARWDDETLQRIGQGLIGFDPEQETRMRERVGELAEPRAVELNANVREEKQGSAVSTQQSALSPEGVVLRGER